MRRLWRLIRPHRGQDILSYVADSSRRRNRFDCDEWAEAGRERDRRARSRLRLFTSCKVHRVHIAVVDDLARVRGVRVFSRIDHFHLTQ